MKILEQIELEREKESREKEREKLREREKVSEGEIFRRIGMCLTELLSVSSEVEGIMQPTSVITCGLGKRAQIACPSHRRLA